MNRFCNRLGLAAVIIAAGGTMGFAQTATTGGIAGSVKDQSGAAIAGATITLHSGQVSRTTTTGDNGNFRIGLLNAGPWTLSLSKPGYITISRAVNIATNDTLTVNLTPAKEGSVTVTVTSSVSSIDTSSNTQGAAIFMDTLDAIPKGRSMNDIIALAPGTVGGGFGSANASIGGGSAAENTYILDGLNTTDFRRGFQGASLVTDFIDQVEVQTGGFKPEFSALGGVFNAITKSGTNDFRGSSWVTFDARGIQAVPKKTLYVVQGGAVNRYDIGAEVSGPIIKDKLFYFVGLDSQRIEAPDSPANIYPGLVDSKLTQDTINFSGKINWYATQNQQLTVSTAYISNDSKQDHLYPAIGNAEWGQNLKTSTTTVSLNYDWTITPSLFLSAKVGVTKLRHTDNPTDTTNPRVIDNHYFRGATSTQPAGPGFGALGGALAGRGFNSGGYDIYSVEDSNNTEQAKVDLSYFLGTHNLKFGISQLNTEYILNSQQSGGFRYSVNVTASNIYRQANNTNGAVKAEYQAIYAQDTWEALPGFKVSYGLRYETQKQKDFNGKTFMDFSNFKDYAQPRLGLIWDMNNDGKSKLSASYGVYFENIPQRLAIRVFANEVFLREYFFRSTGRFLYDGNAANHYGTIDSGAGDLVADFATPFAFDPIAEGTKLPQRTEYTLGYDQIMGNGWNMGIHARHRVLKNPIEDSVITDADGAFYDPGADSGAFGYFGQAILWNPGRSATWTSRPNSGDPNRRFTVDPSNAPGGTLFDKAGNTYDAVDFTAERKTAHSTTNFSYTWSRLEGNYEGVVSSSNGQADGNITASFDYYPYVGTGLLPLDRTHVLKLYGTYRFDLGENSLNLGYNWIYQSGTPMSLFDDGSSSTPPIPDVGGYANATPQNGLLGQYGRTAATNNVDAHLDFIYKAGRKLRVVPSVDIFNLFNTRTETGRFQQATDQGANPDPRYGQSNGFQVGRRFRFGLKFQF